MGVTSLWEILDPVGEKGLNLSELSGKTLAVDLSAWIVQMKTAGPTGLHNIYIRSLFFRVLDFLKLGIKLVFVVDGRAPDVKHKTMVQRQQQQFGSTATTLSSPDRPMLSSKVIKCVQLLDCLGIPCIHSPGEAEALGAHLSRLKKVDGFISPDSDFFCYGGHTLIRDVYKEYKKYYYDIYSMDDIEGDFHLNQRDLITLALLLGCDYDKEGVKYIGKQKAMELLEYFRKKSLDSLDRILGWHDNKELDGIEDSLNNKEKKEPHCAKCEHLGKVSIHEMSGCSVCETELDCIDSPDTVQCDCDWHQQKRHLDQYKVEISVRSKTTTEDGSTFPNREIIDEYLQVDTELPVGATDWTHQDPDIERTVNFLATHLSWKGQKVMEYLNPALIFSRLRTREASSVDFRPVKIIRACKDNRLECYEVEWTKLACDQWTESETISLKVEKELMEEKFADLVKTFKAASQSGKKSKGKKRKTELSPSQTKITSFAKIKKKIDFTDTKLSEKNGDARIKGDGDMVNRGKSNTYESQSDLQTQLPFIE